MDSAMQSSPQEHADTKTAFRKPLNDAANRKYRRRSPVSGSSSSGGSPSPVLLRKDSAKVADECRRKDDRKDLDRDSVRNRHGRNSDSYMHPDQHSRTSHSHHRHEDHSRREKHVENELSSRFGQDHTRRETENDRSIDAHSRDVDRYSRDKYESFGYRSRDKERDASSVEHHRIKDKDLSSERSGSDKKLSNSEDVKSGERDRRKSDRDGRVEKRDYRRDYKDDRSPTYGESRGHRYDSNSQCGNSGHRLKESSGSDHKELDGHRHSTEEKKKYGAREISRHRDGYIREPGDQFEEKSVSTSKDRESPSKKPKLFSLDGSIDHKKDDFKSACDEKQSPALKQAEESVGKVKLEQSYVTDSDIDAAKVAAMKAAELVNRNLIGTGYMSTDQKKKLLWGNKKSTAVEESTHRWDTAMFDDRERQEKFNKLMSLRLPWYLWPIVGCEGRCQGGAQTRQPGWHWPPQSREAESTTAGLGEAIYCRASPKRWSHCWIRPLRISFEPFFSCTTIFYSILLYYCANYILLVTFHSRHAENLICYWILVILIERVRGHIYCRWTSVVL